MPLIDQEDYQAIRWAIHASLSKGDLPDDMIALDLYTGEAQRWAESQITITGAEATGPRAKNAAIYMAAALLVAAVAQVLSQEDATGETVKIKDFNPVEREQQLRERAAELIALLNNDSALALDQRPTSAVRQMSSCVSVLCPTHRVPRSQCGCCGTVLIF